MESTFYLLNLTISGIKNIENEIRLDFSKKKVTKDFDPSRYRVKAIYGENGSGKTGIVTAVQILKELLTNRNYLNQSVNQVFLNEIINKNSQSLKMSCEFATNVSASIQVYQYSVALEKKNHDRYEIVREKLLGKEAGSGATTYRPVFETRDGKLAAAEGEKEVSDWIEIVATNLLETSTLNSVVISQIKPQNNEQERLDYWIKMLVLTAFGAVLNVSLASSDQHELFFLNESIRNPADSKDLIHRLNTILLQAKMSSGLNSRRVPKSEYDKYEAEIHRLTRFLQLFKPDIQSIDIEKQEDKNEYQCELLLNYGSFRVHTEFESTGIKKLIQLFKSLDAAASGDIVFIDEMDANINDIYFTKLIEYFMLYGKGQLVFTTHNTSPMSVLKKNRKSIDFLSNNNKIIPWVTNGNYKPENLYREGMIEYLPFNVEPEDFLGILGD